MSADNWARCPKCARDGLKALEKQEAEVDASYGVVPVEVFDQKRSDLEKAREQLDAMDNTFREDYGFAGAEEGVVTVSYKGECGKCGLKLRFVEDHPIPGLEG